MNKEGNKNHSDNLIACSVQSSSSVMSDSLWPHGLKHARLLCPSQLPELAQTHVHQVSDAIHPSQPLLPLLLLPSIFPSIRVFSSESVFDIRWPKHWSFSFSISPSNEYSGEISFRMDWLDLLTVQRAFKSSTPQFKSINSSVLSLLHSPTLTSIHDHRKNHSLD